MRIAIESVETSGSNRRIPFFRSFRRLLQRCVDFSLSPFPSSVTDRHPKHWGRSYRIPFIWLSARADESDRLCSSVVVGIMFRSCCAGSSGVFMGKVSIRWSCWYTMDGCHWAPNDPEFIVDHLGNRWDSSWCRKRSR
jgi:hypothetical protein